MKVGVFYPTLRKAPLEALSLGIRGLGHEVSDHDQFDGYRDCDVMVMWGSYQWRSPPRTRIRLRLLEDHGDKPVIRVEGGFMRRKHGFYSVGLNHLWRFGDYKNLGSPHDRWEQLEIKLRPWRFSGEVMIAGQLSGDSAVQPWDYSRWLEGTMLQVQRWMTETESPFSGAYFRPHPRKDHSLPTIEKALRKCGALVTLSSTTAIDALIAGVPVFVDDSRSMAYPLALHDLSLINTPKIPDNYSRLRWIADLAYCQWNLAEMREGLPWLHLMEN